jgi:PBP superfamily domain
MRFWKLYQFWIALVYLSYRTTVDCWSINATGGSFPSNVYREATFAYEFQPSGDYVSYFGAGSTTGKCNIMGYWHTGDSLASQSSISAAVKIRDQLICTDACTVQTCGTSSVVSPRFDRLTRRPLIDFAGSDSILKSADYNAFSDLQMFPALAGAVVPVYNIPELRAILNASLVLSRQNIADIFKGKVLYWNDSTILNNNPLLRGTLKKVVHPINVVVRTDSSGTSEIFSVALSMFDPMGLSAPDYSFGATVGTSSDPSWCGLLTDEVQIFTITGCNTAATAINKRIYMKVVDGQKSLRDLTFLCDASAANITGEFLRSNPGAGLSVIVNKISTASGAIKLKVGYGGPSTEGSYWYKPSIVALPPGVAVEVSTLQEGGYFNSHYNSTYFVTPQVQSIWIAANVSNFLFDVSWHSTSGKNYTVGLNAHSTAADIAQAFNASFLGSVSSVQLVNATTQWIEYQITLSSLGSKMFNKFSVLSALKLYDNAVYITTLLDYNNYPIFYDYAHPMGLGGSGR